MQENLSFLHHFFISMRKVSERFFAAKYSPEVQVLKDRNRLGVFVLTHEDLSKSCHIKQFKFWRGL